jgi:DNA-binding CsgD family transcriptional regulator
VAASLLALLLAISTGSFLDGHLTDLMLSQAASRAVDHIQLGVLDRGAIEDLSDPHTPAKLDDLAARLAPAVDMLRQSGSGLLRINVIARDGTVLYSDDPATREHVVPLTKQEFVAALNGQVGRDESHLSTPENADLESRYHDALEVYVPVLVDGRVAGVYEIYEDAGPVRTMRLALWAAVALALVLAFLAAKHRSGATSRPGLVVQNRGSVSTLTPRELEVLQLMTTTHSYREIADKLVIGEETVRTHVKSILHKLGQPDSTRAVVAAVRAGILDLPQR